MKNKECQFDKPTGTQYEKYRNVSLTTKKLPAVVLFFKKSPKAQKTPEFSFQIRHPSDHQTMHQSWFSSSLVEI